MQRFSLLALQVLLLLSHCSGLSLTEGLFFVLLFSSDRSQRLLEFGLILDESRPLLDGFGLLKPERLELRDQGRLSCRLLLGGLGHLRNRIRNCD